MSRSRVVLAWAAEGAEGAGVVEAVDDARVRCWCSMAAMLADEMPG